MENIFYHPSTKFLAAKKKSPDADTSALEHQMRLQLLREKDRMEIIKKGDDLWEQKEQPQRSF